MRVVSITSLSIRCILGDKRLWVGDTSTSSCLVSLPRANPESMILVYVREKLGWMIYG